MQVSRELLEQVLRSMKELVPDRESDDAPAVQGVRKRQENAIHDLRAALAQPEQEPIPYSGADEKPPVFGRRWKLAVDGFGLQRDDLDGAYVHIDDALSVLHAASPQPAPEPDWKKPPEYVPPLVKWAQEQSPTVKESLTLEPLITREQHIALREAFAIGAADSYFAVHPTHDNDVGRMLFERGFARGFDSHERAIEAAIAKQPTEPPKDQT